MVWVSGRVCICVLYCRSVSAILPPLLQGEGEREGAVREREKEREREEFHREQSTLTYSAGGDDEDEDDDGDEEWTKKEGSSLLKWRPGLAVRKTRRKTRRTCTTNKMLLTRCWKCCKLKRKTFFFLVPEIKAVKRAVSLRRSRTQRETLPLWSCYRFICKRFLFEENDRVLTKEEIL
ncbi:hypothetical protein AOLI_G00101910 [Acnodon oligacanthus]